MERPESSVRFLLRAILSAALLLGSGFGDWAPAEAAHSCCCGTPAGVEDACPCPRPEGSRGPQRSACAERATAVAVQAASRKSEASPRKAEPGPAPLACATSEGSPVPALLEGAAPGRDPDLGRHLARLRTHRI